MAHNPEGGGGGDQKQQQQKKKNCLLSTVWRWQLRRGFPLRRRRVQTQRLGGKKPRRRMVALVVNTLRKMKLKLKYVCMVKKLKECYGNLVKDMAEAGASIESFHQRFFMETTFAVPIGITFSGTLYSSRFGPDHRHRHRQPKTLFM